jgi:hypothetical protein
MTLTEKLEKAKAALLAVEGAMGASWSARQALPDTSEGRECKPSVDSAWELLRACQRRLVVWVYDLEAEQKHEAMKTQGGYDA